MAFSQRLAVLVISPILAFVFLFLAFPSDKSPTTKITNFTYKCLKPSLQDTLSQLFAPIRHPITATYTDQSGQQYSLENNIIWTKPLEKKLLIVDIDTREPTGDGQLFNPEGEKVNWKELGMSGGELTSQSIMNHYLYAQIHGYDYKFIQASHMEDHYDTWIAPHILYSMVPDYDFVVTMDADVTISHLEVPLEWMFNRWGITHNTSISMPWDTKEKSSGNSTECKSCDSRGLTVLNTGFIVVQNLPYTMEMLEAWKECTTETRYEGCGKWKEEWSHEQRAFSEYIRYDYNPTGDNIVGIACDDAMGWPGMIDEFSDRIASNCSGKFVRHHTINKDRLKESASTSMMQALSEIMQKSLLEQQEAVYVNESDSKMTDAGKVDLSGKDLNA